MTTTKLATEAATGNSWSRPARGDLVIGFSFSLWPDSSPGRCNELIAKSIRADLARASSHSLPWVGLQWEIYDALAELNTTGFVAAQFVPARAVAGPDGFQPADIRDAGGLIDLLRDGRFPAVRRLADALTIPRETDSASAPASLCAAFNGILDDRWLFEAFDGLVDLADLDRRVDRPELGCLGTEKRRLPTRGLYPNGLRTFQARRVNRLLIEAIVPVRLLARGEYLDAGRVARHVLGTLDVSSIGAVCVYAHPHHRDRCRQQTLTALRERGWTGRDDDAGFGGEPADWDDLHTWDADSAQVWCRSRDNWDAYSRL
ncbi:MAG: hypothetical protein ABI868_17620 [Acidobacteriota bacterium]